MYGSRVSFLFFLLVDFNGLYYINTTLHEGDDYRLRPAVFRIRNSFKNQEVSIMLEISGKRNILDALTKQNLATHKLLNQMLVSGTLPDVVTSKARMVTFNLQVENFDDE